MNKEGYKKFTMPCHTKLWQEKKAKRDNSFGTKLSDGSWYWYTSWVDVVRAYVMSRDKLHLLQQYAHDAFFFHHKVACP